MIRHDLQVAFHAAEAANPTTDESATQTQRATTPKPDPGRPPCAANTSHLTWETTGLNSQRDEIIEIGAARFKQGELVEKCQSFVNPGKPIPGESPI